LLPSGDIKPVSSWFWCIAESGERKTATDDRAFAAQKRREAQLRVQYEAELEAYGVRHKIWDAQAKAVEKEFKNPGAAGSEAHKIALEQLGPEPEKPLGSLLMNTEFTIEGLVNCLRTGQPLYGIIGSEGGQFIGGHGMAAEAKLRTISILSAAWDGDPIKRVRVAETVVLPGRRVGMHLMIQPLIAASALADKMLNNQGFLSRILACKPKSLIGARLYRQPPPESEQILQEYEGRVLKILSTPYPLADKQPNELAPRLVTFSEEAKELFWDFHNEVERQQADGGEYESIKPFASKLKEHAARLAAALAYYDRPDTTELTVDDLERGIRIAIYYAAEARRLYCASIYTDP
jgi:hypothetical protein